MSSLFARKLKTATRVIFTKPQKLVNVAGKNGLLNFLPDKAFLKACYKCETGKKLDLEHPVTIAEKLQWLKVHEHKEIYTTLADKDAVRGYIEKLFGPQYLMPVLGVYDAVDKIPWDELPASFVIKCTHGSGCNVVVKDKAEIDRKQVEKQLESWMHKNWYYFGREWPYKNIKPRVLIEEFQQDNAEHQDLTDYKFYCFGGVPTYCQVIGDRHVENGSAIYYIDFFDMEWNHMPFTGFHAPGHEHPHSPRPVRKPATFDAMRVLAATLAKDTRYVRIDFYEIDGQAKFGEFTLYPMSGFGEFSPEEWNKKLGDMIPLD